MNNPFHFYLASVLFVLCKANDDIYIVFRNERHKLKGKSCGSFVSFLLPNSLPYRGLKIIFQNCSSPEFLRFILLNLKILCQYKMCKTSFTWSSTLQLIYFKMLYLTKVTASWKATLWKTFVKFIIIFQ